MAIILLVMAPLHLIADLEQPQRFYTLFYRTNVTSPISWGSYLLTLYPINCLIYAWFLFRRDIAAELQRTSGWKAAVYRFLTFGKTDLSKEAAAVDAKWAKFFGTLGVPLALMVHGYTGFILANVQARALWHTPLMPFIFLMSAVVSGTGLLILLVLVAERYFSPLRQITRERKELIFDIGRMMMWFIVADACLMVADFIVLYYTNVAGYAVGWMFLHGEHKLSFLGLEVVIGMVLPFVLLLIPKTGRTIPGVITASLLTLVGVLAMRYNFVIGGQQIPLSGDVLNHYHVDPVHLTFIIIFALTAISLLCLSFMLLPVTGEVRSFKSQKAEIIGTVKGSVTEL